MWLNLCGREAILRQLKKRQKMNFLCFQAVFALTLFFFASYPLKSVKATWVSRIGQNDDYPGLQQNSKCA